MPGQGPRQPQRLARARRWQGAGGEGAGARVGLTTDGTGGQAGARPCVARAPPTISPWDAVGAVGGWCLVRCLAHLGALLGTRVVYGGHRWDAEPPSRLV